MKPDRPDRIALLIDADNAPAGKIDVILAELAKAGVTNIRRAYGNWKKEGLKGWEAVLHEYAIRPIQQFDYSKGKNATDMGMVIDAMDLLYTDAPEAFGIVSSDSDFTPLVLHLKAKGATVFGFGEAKTPKPFVNACSRFLYLEHLGAVQAAGVEADAAAGEPAPSVPATAVSPDLQDIVASKFLETAEPAQAAAITQPTPAPAKAAKKAAKKAAAKKQTQAIVPTNAISKPEAPALRRDTAALQGNLRIVNLLRNAVAAAAGEDGWSKLSVVRQQIGNQASFDHRNYGYATFSKLIAATQLFDMRDEGTSSVSVRDRRGARLSPAPSASSTGD